MMEALQRAPETAEDLDRRIAPRRKEHEQLLIKDLDDEGNTKTRSGWSFDTSDNGISFRCRDKLARSVLIEFHPERLLQAEIVWSKEVIAGVWEYGASLHPLRVDGEELSEQLSPDDIQLLLALPREEPPPEDEEDSNSEAVVEYQGRTRRGAIIRMVGVLTVASVTAGFTLVGLLPGYFQVPSLALAAVSLVEIWRYLGES